MEPHRLALTPGYQIEHFRIEATLGKGGFGITYVALDLQLGKRVAIKELLPDSIATRVDGSTVVPQSPSMQENWEWARERFLDEARILAGFSHPAIVGVHRLIEANGTVYIVMDYVEGESYEARLQRIGRETEQVSLMAVIGPILRGLHEVHSAGLIHRDIKPENILISRRGHPILIDFGSARSSIGATMTMTSIVTHGYSPIEQYQTKGRMGPWTDIYAVSAVMFRAITDKKPPVATDRLVNEEVLNLRNHTDGNFRQSFLDAVEIGLAIRPENRPRDVSCWEQLLQQPSEGYSTSVPTTISHPEKPVQEAATNTESSKKYLAVVLGGLACAALAALVVLVVSKSPGTIAVKDNTLEPPAPVIPITDPRRIEVGQNQRDNDKQRKQETETEDVGRNDENPNQQDSVESQTYVNSLGMEFVPLPASNILLSKWETRRKDYREFCDATGRTLPDAGFVQTDDDPVVDVSWDDAAAFCEWLSRKEKKSYRLPTDLEWSKAVGLAGESGSTPEARSGGVEGYPWGNTWPPPHGAGNYSQDLDIDNFEKTSPVGSFEPNRLGIFDLGGNAWEWCGDEFRQPPGHKVVRGGGYTTDGPSENIKASYRNGMPANEKRAIIGFRCALEK
jgi:serine/threonine protein kinase